MVNYNNVNRRRVDIVNYVFFKYKVNNLCLLLLVNFFFFSKTEYIVNYFFFKFSTETIHSHSLGLIKSVKINVDHI